ncbi:MAG: DJ-1/PfpI family protein [Candidatus Aenigmarchaeota archaeon]|nr:DJ-1/PfpI family protein [Candidatus Aenigmarchaeota archaeon]
MKALILIADHFEDIEASTIISVLRKAGVEVTVTSLSSSIVTSTSGVKIIADKKFGEIDPYAYDILILPGGKNIFNSGDVISLVRNFNKKNKFIAAINTSPIILADAGLLDDKIATVFPGYENRLPRPRAAKVVVAKNIITARGPAVALDFSLKLVEVLAGKKTVEKIKKLLAIDSYV